MEEEDPGPRTVPSGSSEFQRALQEVLQESEHHSNGTCRVTIQAPRDKAQGSHHHHQHRQEDRLLQGKAHCYRLHHGNVLPSYSHHRPPSKSPSPSSSRSPNISPSRSPVSPRRHAQGQKGSPPLPLRMRELSVEDAGPMSRQRSNSDCARHAGRPRHHHPSHAPHQHPRDHAHLHPHSQHLHVHWPDTTREGRLNDEPRTRSLSFGAVDGMRKPSKSILKHT